MPIFDFECQSCGHTFEKLVFRRDAEVPCPKCDSGVRKLPSRFAIRGTGPDGKGTGAGGCGCGGSCGGNCSSSCSSCSCSGG